jgi:hypothetical protein
MRNLTLLVAVLLVASAPVVSQQGTGGCYPASGCKADCEKTKREIRKVQAKMRHGYDAAQGEKMEVKLRELRKLRSKYCR